MTSWIRPRCVQPPFMSSAPQPGDRWYLCQLEGEEQVTGRQAAVGPPLLGDRQNLLLAGEVVQLKDSLDGLAQRQIARQDDVLALQRDEQGALQGAQHVRVQPAVRYPLGQVAQRADLPPGQAGLAELAGIYSQQFGRRGEMPADQGLDAGQGAAGGRDGQLL